MYTVVGCSDCGALWLLSDQGKTATCPGCGSRHRTDRLRRFFESEDREAAREARAAMLAERGDHAEAFDALESVAEMEDRLEEAGVGDREYLAAAGLDPDAVAAAGAVESGGSRSREEVLRAALREADPPTEEGVVSYATEHGVDADAARDLLERLVRAGEVTESDGRYRLL